MTNLNLITSTAATIAAQLGETDSTPRATIWRTVRTLGPERAHAFVAQAQEVEANGGMLIPDGSRKRTLGGIFFYLVRTQVSDKEAVAINVMWRSKQQRKKLGLAPERTATPATSSTKPPPSARSSWTRTSVSACPLDVGGAVLAHACWVKRAISSPSLRVARRTV